MTTLTPILAVAVAALAAAGCGGTTNTAPTPPPKLPRALAQSWAQQADAIATALAAGDGCTAETQAIALRTEILQVTNERRIAQPLAARLAGPVNDLPQRITCTPAPPAPEHGPKHEHPKHEHKNKEKHGKQGDEGG